MRPDLRSWWLPAMMAVLCMWSPKARASEGWAIYMDNDRFAPGTTDRDYTGSFAISYAAPENSRLPLDFDKVIGIFGDGRKKEPGTLRMHGFEAGVAAFTPANIAISTPQHEERPYASLVYIAGKRQRVDVRDNSSFTYSLTAGILGLAAAGDVQRELHQLLKNPQAMGWNNQISDGGEPTFRYLWEYRRLQGDYAYEDGRRLQWTTATGLSLGYLTEGVLGISLHYGHLTDPWWSFHSSPTGFGDRMLSVPGQYGNGAGLCLWVSLSGSLRLYNAFLEGQFRDSAVTYDNDQLRPGVAHFSIGAGWTFDNYWRLNYSLQRQTSEVKSGLADRTFTWAGIVLQVPTN